MGKVRPESFTELARLPMVTAFPALQPPGLHPGLLRRPQATQKQKAATVTLARSISIPDSRLR